MSCNISWCGFLSILEEKKSQPLFSRIFRGIWWKTSTGIESFTNVGVGHRQPQIQNQNQNQHQDFKTKWRRLQVLTVQLLNNQVFFALTPVTSHGSHLSVATQSIQIIKEMVFCHYKFHPTYEIFFRISSPNVIPVTELSERKVTRKISRARMKSIGEIGSPCLTPLWISK